MSFTQVTLIGRAAADPVCHRGQANFVLAMTTSSSPGAPADHFRIVTARTGLGEWAEETISKGRLVLVSGYLMSQRYQAMDGTSRELVQIAAETIRALDRPEELQFAPGRQKEAAPTRE